MSPTQEFVALDPLAGPPARDDAAATTLVERYRKMAHEFRPGPVDRTLRALDALVAATLLIAVSPMLLACGLAVMLSGGRPVVYRGPRVGRNGHIFQMYKLRTLRADAEVRLGRVLGPELSRLTSVETTRVGRGLRALKLDELPQLWNVVRGDMSLVGPRPIRPAFFEELCDGIPAYWQRLVVRPGMTGLAQLRLSREMSWAEKLAHDFEYIADRSPRLYASVLLLTVGMLMRRLLRLEA